MKKILSLLLIICTIFSIFSNCFASINYENRDSVDASTDTPYETNTSFYDILCQLPDNVKSEIFEHISVKTSIRPSTPNSRYNSLVGFSCWKPNMYGMVIVRRQSVKNPNTIYYDFICPNSLNCTYTRTSDILSWDATQHLNGFRIGARKDVLRLNNYDKNGVGHITAYIDDDGSYEYTDAGDMYSCDIIFCSADLKKNDGEYKEVTFPAMNSKSESGMRFKWGDHNGSSSKVDIILEQEYNISEKTSILNISVKNYSPLYKLYYSNVMPGIDGKLKTRENLILDPDGKTIMILDSLQSLYFELEDNVGNILVSKTGKFGPTNSLAETSFHVEFDDSVGGSINFTPRLHGIGIASSYEIFLNVVANGDSDLSSLFIQETSFGTNVYLDEDTHYFKLTNNVRFTLLKNFFKSKNITLEFLIYTRTSKTLVLTKTYDFELTSTTTTWTGGTVIEGNKDVDNNYYNKSDMDINKEIESSNSSTNINTSVSGTNSDINIDNIKDFNFNDILKMCSHGFDTFKILFSMLPNFVWGLMTTFIIICIILRLIGK